MSARQSPYRVPATRPGEEPRASRNPFARELWPGLALLWIASLARVVYAIVRAEPFEAEATLAAACVIGIPWLYRDALRSESKRQRNGDVTPAAPH